MSISKQAVKIKVVKLFCIAIMAALTIPSEIVAEEFERYDSPTGLYAFTMPEGYSYYTTMESLNQEIFFGRDGIQNFNITYVDNTPISSVLMSMYSDEIMDSIVQQYLDADLGLSESNFVREGVFETEENNRIWIGLKLSIDDRTSHQCLTSGDDGYTFTLTFTDMTSEDEQTVLNSFDAGALYQLGRYKKDVMPNAGDEEKNSGNNLVSNENAVDATGTEYSLMEGRMSVVIPAEYDVLVKGQTLISEEIAAAHGTSAEKLETWLSMQGNDLVAVTEGGRLDGSSDEIGIRIKPGSYEGVENFKDFPDDSKKILADAIVSGFQGSNGYDLYETEEACFIVFEANMLGEEIRYASIIDESMIYLIYKPASGKLTDEARTLLQQIADTVRFR